MVMDMDMDMVDRWYEMDRLRRMAARVEWLAEMAGAMDAKQTLIVGADLVEELRELESLVT